MAKKLKQIALAFVTAVPHQERIMKGVTDYARRHGRWTFIASPETFIISVRNLRHWAGDGVIAEISTKAEMRMAREIGLPIVNLSGALRNCDVPRVMVDHEAIGRLAAEHLLQCGFHRFAYYGLKSIWYGKLRGRGFRKRIAKDNRPCSVLEVPSSVGGRRAWYDWKEPLEAWIKTLEPPVGLMAAHDLRARMVLEVCGQLGLRVPEDVAIIGVNNDELVCEFCEPPISSVSRSGEEVGYEAAALLDRLMTGNQPPDGDLLIPPDGVVQRGSTDVVGAEYPFIATAVQFIRENISRPFCIQSLVELVPVSRRWLEHRFRQSTGKTLHEYICEARVERAKELLSGPQRLPLYAVAETCGFTETRHFRIVFERIAGVTPAAYRRAHKHAPKPRR